MRTPDLNWNLERNKNPLYGHRGPFASSGLDETEVTCSNIWLLQEIQVILFNDLELEMYYSIHLSLVISVEHWSGLEMKLKNDGVVASQAGGKDVWEEGGLRAAASHHGRCEYSRMPLIRRPWQAGLEFCWSMALNQPFPPTLGNKMWM